MTAYRTAAGATIRRLLNLSTAHLPKHLGTPGGLDTAPGVIAHPTETGYLLWVPDDPDESAQATTDPVPDVVLAIQRYARALNCDYVLSRTRDNTYYSEPLVIPRGGNCTSMRWARCPNRAG